MKNEFCDLSEDEISALPEDSRGFLLSRFYKERGFVFVPEDTFKEMIDIVAVAGQKARADISDATAG